MRRSQSVSETSEHEAYSPRHSRHCADVYDLGRWAKQSEAANAVTGSLAAFLVSEVGGSLA